MGSHPSWDPKHYELFLDLRLRPALDLLSRVTPASPQRIVDLGCGTGRVTELLAQRFPEAQVTGVDASREMLERARAAEGRARYIEGDIAHFTPTEPLDLLVSNAALHWVADHEALFPRLLGDLAAGGVLAVQMPLSWPQDSHRLMREVLADGGLDGQPLGDPELRARMERRPVEEPAFYYDCLADHASRIDLWTTEYVQVLEGEDPVLAWVEGTGLRPILQGLAGAELERFLERYRVELRAAYPRRADGRTLFPFRRLFLVASR
jgi:trans-aconitate 2-methyltransferase